MKKYIALLTLSLLASTTLLHARGGFNPETATPAEIDNKITKLKEHPNINAGRISALQDLQSDPVQKQAAVASYNSKTKNVKDLKSFVNGQKAKFRYQSHAKIDDNWQAVEHPESYCLGELSQGWRDHMTQFVFPQIEKDQPLESILSHIESRAEKKCEELGLDVQIGRGLVLDFFGPYASDVEAFDSLHATLVQKTKEIVLNEKATQAELETVKADLKKLRKVTENICNTADGLQAKNLDNNFILNSNN